MASVVTYVYFFVFVNFLEFSFYACLNVTSTAVFVMVFLGCSLLRLLMFSVGHDLIARWLVNSVLSSFYTLLPFTLVAILLCVDLLLHL